MKTLMMIALSVLFMAPQRQNTPSPDDFQIVHDYTENGVRSIVAKPVMVCSKSIEIKVDVNTMKIKSVVYTGGCNGNLKAVNALVSGLTVQQTIDKLSGIDCGGRGTSCTDQLARVLKRCFK